MFYYPTETGWSSISVEVVIRCRYRDVESQQVRVADLVQRSIAKPALFRLYNFKHQYWRDLTISYRYDYLYELRKRVGCRAARDRMPELWIGDAWV